MKKNRRIFAILLSFLLLFALIFSLFAVTVSANHDCAGESCAVCRQVSQCENLLRFLFSALFALCLSACGLFAATILPDGRDDRNLPVTLVSLGVKLSD